jgi:hypothetical protein
LQWKLPGVPRLQKPPVEQPVAVPCQAIPPVSDEVVDKEIALPKVPSVDEIHTKIAQKLEVRNAIAAGSSGGVSLGGRVGAAQVRIPGLLILLSGGPAIASFWSPC